MSSSVGMITPNIWKLKNVPKPPVNIWSIRIPLLDYYRPQYTGEYNPRPKHQPGFSFSQAQKRDSQYLRMDVKVSLRTTQTTCQVLPGAGVYPAKAGWPMVEYGDIWSNMAENGGKWWDFLKNCWPYPILFGFLELIPVPYWLTSPKTRLRLNLCISVHVCRHTIWGGNRKVFLLSSVHTAWHEHLYQWMATPSAILGKKHSYRTINEATSQDIWGFP